MGRLFLCLLKLPNFQTSEILQRVYQTLAQKVLMPLADVAHSAVTVIKSDIRKILVGPS
jgi:hypothetical protein